VTVVIKVTRRQQQCLAFSLLYGNEKGSKMLGITPQTMKNNVGTVYRRLGVNSRSQAASRLGWLKVPDHLMVRNGRL
jgi:DNA-binding CsgD family transcriptional regulator